MRLSHGDPQVPTGVCRERPARRETHHSSTGALRKPPTSSTTFYAMDELGHLVVNLATFLHETADLLDRVDHGGVVATTEFSRDGGIAEVGEFAAYIHPNLTRGDERPPA